MTVDLLNIVFTLLFSLLIEKSVRTCERVFKRFPTRNPHTKRRNSSSIVLCVTHCFSLNLINVKLRNRIGGVRREILYHIYIYIIKFPGWKPITLSVVCLSVAMLCKEQGITMAGVCGLYEIFVAQKVRKKSEKKIYKSVRTKKKNVYYRIVCADNGDRSSFYCLKSYN